MLLNCICVGAGGFIGSVARYLISISPLQSKSDYPLHTLITNIIGAFLIGLIIARADRSSISPEKLLLLKTGLCGGLTTFSTFSAETFSLFQSGSLLAGTLYVILSVALCFVGVGIGMMIGQRI